LVRQVAEGSGEKFNRRRSTRSPRRKRPQRARNSASAALSVRRLVKEYALGEPVLLGIDLDFEALCLATESVAAPPLRARHRWDTSSSGYKSAIWTIRSAIRTIRYSYLAYSMQQLKALAVTLHLYFW